MNRSYCIALKGGLDLPLEYLVLRVVYDIAHTHRLCSDIRNTSR